MLAVVTTNPSPGGVITLTGGNRTVRVFFNEAVNPATVGTGDFLVNQGTVVGATPVLGNTAVDVVISGLVAEGSLTLNIGANAFTDTAGNANPAGFSATYVLDYVTRPYPTPLTPKTPLGSLIYDPSIGGLINFAGDTDSFTLNVDPGQTITVLVDPAGTPTPRCTAASATAGRNAGQLLLINQTTGAGTRRRRPGHARRPDRPGLRPRQRRLVRLDHPGAGSTSTLVRIDPNTGALLSARSAPSPTARAARRSASATWHPAGHEHAVRHPLQRGRRGHGRLALHDRQGDRAWRRSSATPAAGAGGGIAFAPGRHPLPDGPQQRLRLHLAEQDRPGQRRAHLDGAAPRLLRRPGDPAQRRRLLRREGGSGDRLHHQPDHRGRRRPAGHAQGLRQRPGVPPLDRPGPDRRTPRPVQRPHRQHLGRAGAERPAANGRDHHGRHLQGHCRRRRRHTGGYTVQVVLNAALERRDWSPGRRNDTRATAQDINGSFANLDTALAPCLWGAVLGSLGANSVTLTALDSGWYDSTGFHDSFNKNYFLGDPPNQYRDCFVFNLAGLTPGFTSAQLNLFNPADGYSSPSRRTPSACSTCPRPSRP